MSDIVFKTGKRHQEAAAIWARRRLADKAGRCFSSPENQVGVLFADSVGLGKTWEALAAAALILCKRERPQKGLRHILILCPANLVTKWEDELTEGSPFQEKLDAWFNQRKDTGLGVQVVRKTLAQVFPIRSAKHVPTKLKRGKFHPPGGTYIVSQSLITGTARGLKALRRENWDIVIVDEAHNATARKALEMLQERKRASTKLLLTATPFQLEPRQLNSLAANLVKDRQKVLNRPEVNTYIKQLAEVFESVENNGPTPNTVEKAGKTLRMLAARTVPRSANRCYRMLMLDGTTEPLGARLQDLDNQAVERKLGDFRRNNEELRDKPFEKAYFKQRLLLAAGEDSTYVATKLRLVLSMGVPKWKSPRLRALQAWARKDFRDDIERALKHGLPQKTILFTSWVGKCGSGAAAKLKELLAEAFDLALGDARREHGAQWFTWRKDGANYLNEKAKEPSQQSVNVLAKLSEDELTAVLAGKDPRFAGRIAKDLMKKIEAISKAEQSLKSVENGSFEKRTLRRRIKGMRAALLPGCSALCAVERYTGNERRSARDRAATAFREVGPPWVLVASNIGAEGIDLHTYTARIIHYDLEWNPAKMEQREGRGDRVGRKLRDKLMILYCLVPRTYDERMFHQLVARERWLGVLLGKPAAKLDDGQVEAPLIDSKRIRDMRLDLKPS